MLKAIKIRIYPNDDQKDYLSNLFGCSRFVYNSCLNYKIQQYNNHKKSIGFGETGRYLTDMKKQEELSWLRNAHSKVLQQSLINLDMAYKSFFKNGRGFPKFKSKHSKQSVRFPNDAIGKITGNRINIIRPLKDILFKCSTRDEKYLNKRQKYIKSGSLSKTKSGNYYFSILIDRPSTKTLPKTDNMVGIDLGIKDFIITSNGEFFENIKIKRNNYKKLSKLHRNLSRKVKGSKNKEKQRIKLSKFYEKLNNQKEYYQHQVSNSLLNENQVIVMETLNVKNMMKNHKLARSIQEVSWSRFKTILMYKAKWYNREIIEIDKWFPSSKLCNVCGYKNKELELKDRTWCCPNCNTTHNRDVNASLNILNEGKRIIGMSSPELTLMESSQ